MSAVDPTVSETGDVAVGRDVFALTDEQIVGLGGEERAGDELPAAQEEKSRSLAGARDDNRIVGANELSRQDAGATTSGHTGTDEREIPRSADAARNDGLGVVPGWLAERMRDPRDGEAAKELWDGKQRAEKEIAAYREVFATAEDARALKEIYPGGMTEAKAAAERARELDAIDAAFYRGDAAARGQLAQRMMLEDPRAFREMVEAGVRLLREVASDEWRVASGRGRGPRSAESARNDGEGVRAREESRQDADATSLGEVERTASEGGPYNGKSRVEALHKGGSGQAGAGAAPEVVRAYGEFEKAANAELEKSVGGAIARVMEQALPNLRKMTTTGQDGTQHAAPLRERLTGAVREEVDAALRSDRELGEQVGRILAGRQFDEATRAQAVRLIDARAQQLVPGAVQRVVGSWTSATLGNGRNAAESSRGTTNRSAKKEPERAVAARNEKAAGARRDAGTSSKGRRVDYGRLSDEEILGM